MSNKSTISVDGLSIKTTQRGFLTDPTTWNKRVAEALAKDEGIELTAAHWEIIDFARDFYHHYNLLPNVRLFTQAVRKTLGNEKGNSRYLYHLFPESPLKQSFRIGGLPLPPSCI